MSSSNFLQIKQAGFAEPHSSLTISWVGIHNGVGVLFGFGLGCGWVGLGLGPCRAGLG